MGRVVGGIGAVIFFMAGYMIKGNEVTLARMAKEAVIELQVRSEVGMESVNSEEVRVKVLAEVEAEKAERAKVEQIVEAVKNGEINQ